MQAPADSTWRGFSIAERDRRWTAVRANAAQAGFDCIFVPQCIDSFNLRLSLEGARGNRSDSRYLTQMENAVFILPTDGRSPIAINDRGGRTSWFTEVRPASRDQRGSWVNAAAQALRDAGMERARIGVSGLKRGKYTHSRAFDGVVSHTFYGGVMGELPNATFADATDVVGAARYVKSDEEIDCIRRAATIAAAGIDEMVAAARPGMPAATLYARVMRRMTELGSEYYPLALYPAPIDEVHPRMENPPIGVTLERGYLLTNETDAVWGGLIAQEVQPIVIGPIPETYKPVIDLHHDLYHAGLEYMKPGTEFADLIDFVNGFGAKRGMKSLILMHGRGYGNDGPLLTPQESGQYARDVRVEKGNVWVWKPIAYSAGGDIQFSWGGCVVVTERGGEPLIQCTHQMVSTS